MTTTTNDSIQVKLIDYAGGDMSHAASAWTSTLTDVEKNKHRIPGLLKTLAKAGHGTPFEKSYLHFIVHTDMATHIHLLKHRVGVSVNGQSARYKELKDDCYLLPQDWSEEAKEKLREYTEVGLRLYHEVCEELTPIIGRKRAKESSRFFRTMNTMLWADISFNFRSFWHFYKLRSAPDAQEEVRYVANEMMRIVREIPDNPFEATLKAFEATETNKN